MMDEDRKRLCRWFDVCVKSLIQIGGADSNYMFTDDER